jgi:glutamate dehydrogenase/leucine dehydrogenase
MSLNRRTFSAATALGSTRILGANDRVRCATIGTGNRGSYLTRQFKELGAEMVAVCDDYEPRLQEGFKEVSTAREALWTIATAETVVRE